MKKCSICQHEKDASEFNKNRKRKDGLQTMCKECSRKRSRQYYSENKEKHGEVVKLSKTERVTRNQQFVYGYKLAHPCPCGQRHPAALDFHHLDRITKKYTISSMVGDGYSIEAIENEIAKCAVMCKNCHAIHTCEEGNHYTFQGKFEATDSDGNKVFIPLLGEPTIDGNTIYFPS
jgi:hypothetical protein